MYSKSYICIHRISYYSTGTNSIPGRYRTVYIKIYINKYKSRLDLENKSSAGQLRCILLPADFLSFLIITLKNNLKVVALKSSKMYSCLLS